MVSLKPSGIGGVKYWRGESCQNPPSIGLDPLIPLCSSFSLILQSMSISLDHLFLDLIFIYFFSFLILYLKSRERYVQSVKNEEGENEENERIQISLNSLHSYQGSNRMMITNSRTNCRNHFHFVCFWLSYYLTCDYK